MNRKFANYRAYLASPEYAAEMAKLLATGSKPPREDYPVNVPELVERHRAYASMAIEGAARHMRIAEELSSQVTA